MTEGGRPPIVVRPDELPPEAATLPPGGTAPAAAGSRGHGLAWCSFGLGAASILFAGVAVGPVAMVTGIVAAVRADRRDGPGRMTFVAVAGLLMGLAGTILWGALLYRWLDTAASKRAAATPPAVPITMGSLDREAIEHAPEPIRRALASSASLEVQRRSGTEWLPESSGSGTFVWRAGDRFYVLTCAHVAGAAADGDRRLRARWLGGEMREPRLEWVAPAWLDLAIVSTGAGEGEGEPSLAPLVAAAGLGVGEPVFAIGDPHQYRVSYVSGVLSAVRIVTEGPVPLRVLQSQVPLNPGNSGGGLYNAAGQLIGVNSWKLAGAPGEGMGFSIAIDNLWVAARDAPEEVGRVVEAMRKRAGGIPEPEAGPAPDPAPGAGAPAKP